jgi:hypothetical protein
MDFVLQKLPIDEQVYNERPDKKCPLTTCFRFHALIEMQQKMSAQIMNVQIFFSQRQTNNIPLNLLFSVYKQSFCELNSLFLFLASNSTLRL